jgi:hypothetical protein
MPAFSASVAGRAAAGAQVPQAPLPDIKASQPFAFAMAARRAACRFCCAGSSLPAACGN